ncbi:MAG TPA: hypothetical protein VG963_10745, partial [Polyangiaceae bacterium]|nr:hypothetical protein [Polyangiaceae bacterium]
PLSMIHRHEPRQKLCRSILQRASASCAVRLASEVPQLAPVGARAEMSVVLQSANRGREAVSRPRGGFSTARAC